MLLCDQLCVPEKSTLDLFAGTKQGKVGVWLSEHVQSSLRAPTLISPGNQRFISPICMDYPRCRRDRCDRKKTLDYAVRSACNEKDSCSHTSEL